MPSINLEMDDVKIVITALANYLSDIAETGQAMTANNKERAKALFESGKRVDSLMKKITAMADEHLTGIKNEVKEEIVADRIRRSMFGGRKR